MDSRGQVLEVETWLLFLTDWYLLHLTSARLRHQRIGYLRIFLMTSKHKVFFKELDLGRFQAH